VKNTVLQRIHHSPSWLNHLNAAFPAAGLAVAAVAVNIAAWLPYSARLFFAYALNLLLQLPGFYVRLVQRLLAAFAVSFAGAIFYFGFLALFRWVPGVRKLGEPPSRALAKDPEFFRHL
jgi:hypothetical protein